LTLSAGGANIGVVCAWIPARLVLLNEHCCFP
jgi:hypothetical protein